MSGAIQSVFQNQRSFASAIPTTIGEPFGGGFYAGKIAVGGGGVATHYLIVAPKSSGESLNIPWGLASTVTGINSVVDGPANSAALAALGAAYQAATFCEGLSIAGYTDWYLPARNELEVLYYFLKPGTTLNNISYGANSNAAPPEPIDTNYTSINPAQTPAGIGFRTGETNYFDLFWYWSSTESSSVSAFSQLFDTGAQNAITKTSTTRHCRAVRRIAI